MEATARSKGGHDAKQCRAHAESFVHMLGAAALVRSSSLGPGHGARSLEPGLNPWQTKTLDSCW